MRYGSKLRRSRWTQAALVLFCLLAALPAHAAEPGAAPGDPVPELILSLAVILVGAKLGGHVAARIRQPPVLGELLVGVVLGNLTLFGFHGLDFLKTSSSVAMLAELGVILLLFQVGLESTVAQMLKVGLSSFLVATLGIIGPFLLGVGVGMVLLPGESIYAQIFLGATLTATSVGITARVLKDLGRSQSGEARIILGAAVIDDVQGLIILAVVTGIIHAASVGISLSMPAITLVVVKAAAFLIGALLIGTHMSPKMFAFGSKLKSSGVLLAAGLSFCFFLAWLASRVGLAPIVGAFAAGLILEDLHYRDFVDRGEHSLEELVEPIASFLVPVFFVLMGMRTDLRAFTRPGVLGLAAGLTLAAIVGKQLCSLGVLGKEFDRLSIGIGMIPRGEVGLIFANIGLTLVIAGQPVVNPSVFAAVVVMVIVTTVITPPMLSWSFNRQGARESVVARGAAAGN
jgi:Kef-type K+ transport system membrane component KefB